MSDILKIFVLTVVFVIYFVVTILSMKRSDSYKYKGIQEIAQGVLWGTILAGSWDTVHTIVRIAFLATALVSLVTGVYILCKNK